MISASARDGHRRDTGEDHDAHDVGYEHQLPPRPAVGEEAEPRRRERGEHEAREEEQADSARTACVIRVDGQGDAIRPRPERRADVGEQDVAHTRVREDLRERAQRSRITLHAAQDRRRGCEFEGSVGRFVLPGASRELKRRKRGARASKGGAMSEEQRNEETEVEAHGRIQARDSARTTRPMTRSRPTVQHPAPGTQRERRDRRRGRGPRSASRPGTEQARRPMS